MNNRLVTPPPARRIRHASATALVLLALAGSGASAAAAGAADPYALTLKALTGPQGADLTLAVDTAPGAAAVDTLKKVQVKIFEPDGSLAAVRNVAGLELTRGAAAIALGPVERGRRIEADVLVQPDPDARTHVARAETVTRLRPDLVVAAIYAPPQTTTTRPIGVVAEIRELNGETPAAATVTLMAGPEPLAAPARVSVAAGGTASVTFSGVELASPVPTRLSVHVTEAAPDETDATNNAGEQTVDVTEHELVAANVLVPSLGGYGAQFNQHVYAPAPLTALPPDAFPDLEDKVKAFEPQLVRIFYNDDWEELRATAPQNLESFYRTVALAQAAGATINITYHTIARARLQPPAVHMARFAALLDDLVRNRGFTNVRWATVGNEPNTPGAALTLPEWHGLYRALHEQLVARGLRDHVHIMGGDLVESSGARDHEVWFKYMTENMLDIVDAYSEHIYWQYWDVRRFEFRLRDVRKLVVEDNPTESRRPAYVMEFGVRGLGTAAGKPTLANAYYEDGTELRRTNIAAFQQLWFNIASAQLGFAGTSKWDLYWGLYDLSSRGNQVYWMMNPTASGWELFPTYHALRLLLGTTERGWQVLRVAPWERDDWDPLVQDQPEKELVAYAGSNGRLTLVGLDTHGGALNSVSAETAHYSIGGLAPRTNLTLALWNATGDGESSVGGTVTTNDAGVARFDVPLHAAFALTTVPVS